MVLKARCPMTNVLRIRKRTGSPETAAAFSQVLPRRTNPWSAIGWPRRFSLVTSVGRDCGIQTSIDAIAVDSRTHPVFSHCPKSRGGNFGAAFDGELIEAHVAKPADVRLSGTNGECMNPKKSAGDRPTRIQARLLG
jgi:hypothetical protein